MSTEWNLTSSRPNTSLLLSIAFWGCALDSPTTETTTSIAPTHQQQMSVDSQYMMHVHEKIASPIGASQIDLADPKQYQFVMNRLAAAGKSSANSPELFNRLQRSRDRVVSGLTTTTDWCATRIQLGPERRVGSTMTFPKTHPIVSCVGGASYVYADIATYNSNVAGTENYLVTSAAGEDYSGGTDFTTIETHPALPATVGRVNKTDSLVIAYDAIGNEQLTYNNIRTHLAPVPATLNITHPQTHSWIQNNGNIQICQLRGDAGQCDYGVGRINGSAFSPWSTNPTGIAAVKANTGGNTFNAWQGDITTYRAISGLVASDLTHVYVPLLGTLDAGATNIDCRINSISSAEFRLIKTVSGGICTTTGSFPVTLQMGSRYGSFDTVVDFNNNGGTSTTGDCSMSRIVNDSVKPSLTIRMETTCGPRIASMAPGHMPPLPEYIEFLNSCFAKGTRIRRVDGSSSPVESLRVGDKVISDNKGTALTVIGISHGNEAEPLVALRDDKGHKLRLTSKHPMITAAGDVVFASAIQKHDRVITERGITSIVAVERVPYSGQVYNLRLGTPEEQAKVGRNRTTMFAGGFLVGDAAMQQEHSKPRRLVAKVPREWARDYQNALANDPSMARLLR